MKMQLSYRVPDVKNVHSKNDSYMVKT